MRHVDSPIVMVASAAPPHYRDCRGTVTRRDPKQERRFHEPLVAGRDISADERAGCSSRCRASGCRYNRQFARRSGTNVQAAAGSASVVADRPGAALQ